MSESTVIYRTLRLHPKEDSRDTDRFELGYKFNSLLVPEEDQCGDCFPQFIDELHLEQRGQAVRDIVLGICSIPHLGSFSVGSKLLWLTFDETLDWQNAEQNVLKVLKRAGKLPDAFAVRDYQEYLVEYYQQYGKLPDR